MWLVFLFVLFVLFVREEGADEGALIFFVGELLPKEEVLELQAR